MHSAKLLAGLIVLGASLSAHADIAVITHKHNPLNTLAPADIKRIFLKQTGKFPDGNRAIVSTLPGDLPITRSFYATALKMSGNQWHTYWAQYTFSGQKSTPQQLRDQETMRTWVAQTPGALGFVHVDWVDDSVKVLRTLDVESRPCDKNPGC